jgi:Rne/Rng family ribonuclease
MNKELFVSATPHEIKVGMVEDDQLAEVYLERENEYTLAGSIYKGRVTRVLPGMQSAFVDIGLERDAFLYVSDFMELEAEDGDLDDSPALPVQEFSQSAASEPTAEFQGEGQAAPQFVPQSAPAEGQPSEGRERSGGRDREGRGGFRGRRRRGRRDGGQDRGPERGPERSSERGPERSPERVSERSSEPPRFSRPAPSESRSRESRPPRDEYGPPPGYQPIVLPGESISKYRGLSPQPPVAEAPAYSAPAYSSEEAHEPQDPHVPVEAITETFPQDEPLFTEAAVTEEPAVATFRALESKKAVEPEIVQAEPAAGSEEDAWDREQKRRHQMNVAATFGRETDETEEDRIAAERSGQRAAWVRPVESAAPVETAPTVEEEEIDEEEAGVASYADELEEDEAFDEMEMEEEIQSAGDLVEQSAEREIAASAENGNGATPGEVASGESVEAAHAEGEEEGDDASAEEAELEEAQAEAEALLAAEAVGNGSVDARVEVRAPATTAAYTQRARRPGFDRNRDRGRGGRRPSGGGGGGGKFRRNEQRNLPLITDLLKEGQEILVQIAKEPIGKKGARITSHIALPGRFLVYMPTVNHTGVSRKIASEEERLRLKRIIQSEKENGHGGFIVRTAAQGADEQELRADIRFLKGLWNEIRTRAEDSKPPALIYHDLNIVERILRDQVTADFSAIWVDTEQEYERILRFANRFQPGLVRRVKLYSKEVPLFEQFGLKDEIDKALKSKVWLKSGGYIVINQTEALVAIDVNTGKYVGKTARLEDTIVKTNVDAIKEIVRQIRLRDLGGIIIIDFIDMDERRNRQKVMQALEEALRGDRAPSKVLQFNDFGLVAITRKRVKQSLERTIGTPCPYCESTGYVKSVNTVCNEIYVEMRKIAKQLDHTDVMLRVNPEVAKTLKTEGGRWLNELEELTKKTVIVKSDPALHQEQFDIN